MHHDNTPSHKSIILNEFLVKTSTNIIEKLPYSPDISPAGFFLSRKLKFLLQGSRFQSIKDIKENSRRELKSISENAFKKCIDDWIIRWNKCIIWGGAYLKAIKYFCINNKYYVFHWPFPGTFLTECTSQGFLYVYNQQYLRAKPNNVVFKQKILFIS